MEQDISKNDLIIERYLQDDLTSEEAAAFEEVFLGSGELLDQLESAESLEKGLREIARLKKIPSVFHSPWYSMAASFLLVVSLGIMGAMYQRVGDPGEYVNTTATPAQIVPLVSVRGGPNSEPVNNIRLGPDSPPVILMLDPGFGDYSQFRASVIAMATNGSRATIMQVDGLIPGYEDMLALSVPASLLHPGDFEVHVEGWREEWPADHAFDPVSVLTLRVHPLD